MYKMHLKRAGLNAFDIQHLAGIPMERAKRIYSGSMDPWRGEVALVDKICHSNGLLVWQYCAMRCPEGKYIGISYEDKGIQALGLQSISKLGEAERLIPIAAAAILDGLSHPQYRATQQKLADLGWSLISTAMHMAIDTNPRTEKEKAQIRACCQPQKKYHLAVGPAEVVTL